MRYVYGKIDWDRPDRARENSYLLTNGLGGYSSLSMVGSNARNDHALLMASLKAPTDRYHMVTRLEETLEYDGRTYFLSSQEYVDKSRNKNGHQYLQSFVFEDFPVWMYQIQGVQIRKTIVMEQGSNVAAVQYIVTNRSKKDAVFTLTPLLQFVAKGSLMPLDKEFTIHEEPAGGSCLTRAVIESDGIGLECISNGRLHIQDTQYIEDLYYDHDNRDGRQDTGNAAVNHSLSMEIPAGEQKTFEIVWRAFKKGQKFEKPLEQYAFQTLYKEEKERLGQLEEQSGLKDPTALQLVKAASQFIVDRESTGGKSIIAGYPFFGDWGRDTMIALLGCCLSTRRFEDAKNIFRTFMKYCKKGIMPNMFPEGNTPPMYNTVDASLLFIQAVYEYYLRTRDLEFVQECWPVMEEIVSWYQKGTDFDIRMDQDGLIEAGSGMDQVTWMDVRFEDILPTPRHGKPVEINAYWYSDLKIMETLAKLLGKDGSSYAALAETVKDSFRKKFWNEEKHCLRDFLAKEEPELPEEEQTRRKKAQDQVRCNQIWTVCQPFGMLDKEQEQAVVDTVFEKLYTPRGLRSLAMDEEEFVPQYMGEWKHRDLAYHQGTVWGFPLGGYFLAYLKIHKNSAQAKEEVRQQLEGIEGALREGCIGQLAEVYDGADPVVSEGCFAQAWSTSELLRVYEALEKE